MKLRALGLIFLPCLAGIFIILQFRCGNSSQIGNGGVVSNNAQTSGCGGFSHLAKRTASGLQPEDTALCLEETLFWRYDSVSRILTLTHRHVNAKCNAELQMYVTRDGSVFSIHQQDLSSPNVTAGCFCPFDLYCEVPNVENTTIELSLDTLIFTVSLAEGSGKEIIRPLEYLSLYRDSFPDLSFLSAYPRLTTLENVDAEKYPDLSPIGRLPNLKSLSCSNVDSLGFLDSCASLEVLKIAGTDKLVDLSALGSLPGLLDISISGASSLSDISPIGNCRACTTLTLSDCPGTDDIGPLSTLTELRTLVVSKCPAIADLSSVAALSKLTTISFSPASNIASLQPLSGLTELVEARFSGLPKVNSVEPLRLLTKLERLEIGDNDSITDISPLAGLTSLQSLILTNMTSIQDFSPLLSCLGNGDLFIFQGTTVPQSILDQLQQKGVNYKN
jgi:Leucine-rich repeat (LRR) protein